MESLTKDSVHPHEGERILANSFTNRLVGEPVANTICPYKSLVGLKAVVERKMVVMRLSSFRLSVMHLSTLVVGFSLNFLKVVVSECRASPPLSAGSIVIKHSCTSPIPFWFSLDNSHSIVTV